MIKIPKALIINFFYYSTYKGWYAHFATTVGNTCNRVVS